VKSSYRTRVTLGLTASLLAVAGQAMASEDYSRELERLADTPCVPPCTLCHRDQNGGFGSVRLKDGGKPFGDALMQLGGLKGSDRSGLAPALETLRQAGTDSDGDAEPDLEELTAGRDPNLPGASSFCGPTYGCEARVAPMPERWATSLALVAALLLAAHRASQRRGRRR
jgi:ABC-type transporter Mla subunit MlaD